MRIGTRGFDTTALPSAASVGASIVPEHRGLPELEIEEQVRHDPPEADRQRQTDPEQPGREDLVAPLDALTALASVNSTTTNVAVKHEIDDLALTQQPGESARDRGPADRSTARLP